MKYELNAIEARIVGCLIEKSITTPDYYPLSLNSLMAACNQKSNREPIMNLSESEGLEVVEHLIARRLVSDESGFHQRTTKYQHRFCNTEFGDLQFDEKELGIICCLLLRGPQTPGELRTRTNRLCALVDVKEAEGVLEGLIEKEFVSRLPREPGKREIRYQQTFTAADSAGSPRTDTIAGTIAGTDTTETVRMKDAEEIMDRGHDGERLRSLERDVEMLKSEMQALKETLDELLN